MGTLRGVDCGADDDDDVVVVDASATVAVVVVVVIAAASRMVNKRCTAYNVCVGIISNISCRKG